MKTITAAFQARSQAWAFTLSLLCVAATAPAFGQAPPKYSAEVPDSIVTPDTVETRIGTLNFFDGLPDDDTIQKAYDQLDFGRGVETFISGIPAASVYGLCEGFREAGFPPNEGIGVTESRADARSLFLTPNSTVVYVWFCADVEDGPMVVEVPPGVLGIIDDAYFRYVTDVGFPGPDQGKGGKYLVVPPNYTGSLPSDGYFVNKSRTYSNLVIIRAFVQDGDVAAAVKNVKDHARMYPLSAAANPPPQKFVNISGLKFNTVHANDFHFYEELNAVVQHEPADWVDPELAGLFAAIGIQKGMPFAPDARMKAILTDAVAVGNAAARAIVFAPRDPRLKIFPTGSGSPPSSAAATSLSMCCSASRYARHVPLLRHRRHAGDDGRAAWQWLDVFDCGPRLARAATSTEPRPTRSRCRRRSPPAGSGRSPSTTTRPARCWRPTRPPPASTARFPT